MQEFALQWGLYLFFEIDHFEGYLFIDQGIFKDAVIEFELEFPEITLKNPLKHKYIDF